MNLKKKFADIKKKIEENRVATDACVIAGCVATAAYSTYVFSRVIKVAKDVALAREDVALTDAVIRNIIDGARHTRETGHPVTFFNNDGEAMFVMNAPEPEED